MNQIYRQAAVSYLLVLFLLVNKPTNIFAADGTIKAKETHQTLIGFGAAIAWTEYSLTTNPKKGEIYNYIFNDLGLDILRLKNSYRNGQINSSSSIAQIVDTMYALSPSRPKILICSWTPPENLKSNNKENGGSNATLKKVDGQFVYRDFANYWVNAINAYKAIGADPDYISIQNEPSYDAAWESCRFEPSETSTLAGYGKALDTVYSALQQAGLYPKILAAEAHGIGYNTFQNYASRFNRTIIDGYAYHLYHGDDGTATSASIKPDAFNSNLIAVGNVYTDKPIWQTEFDRGDWLQTAWLMQNCLVKGNVSAYLWWQLVWGSGGKPLIEVGNDAYSISQYYWMFRQFSKYTESGWKRVTAAGTQDSLRISAFVSPEGYKLTAIIVNIGTKNDSLRFAIQDFTATSGIVIRTSASENGVQISSSYDGTTYLSTPGRSITTIAFTGSISNINDESYIPTGFSLSQNYPNPFNPSTKINYALPQQSRVTVKVYSVLGREVRTLINDVQSAGYQQVVWNSRDYNGVQSGSGVYFFRLIANPIDGSGASFIQTKKMLLVK